MGQFRLEFEQRRLAESGVIQKQRVKSIEDNLWAVVAERTESINHFSLDVGNVVTAKGYEHRGDLSNTFNKSVEEKEREQETSVAKRYELENSGWNQVKKQFFKVPLYSSILLFSPPPEIPIEGYSGYSLAYFYHVLPTEDVGKRTVKALSWINKFEKEEQADILNTFKGEEQAVIPTESSILTSPRNTHGAAADSESFRIIWSQIGEVYKRKDRDFLYPPFEIAEKMLLQGSELRDSEHPDLSFMIKEIAGKVTGGAQEQDLAKQWAIMLNLADNELLHKDVTEARAIKEPLLIRGHLSSSGLIFDRYRHLAYAPRQIATPCGLSGGMTGAVSSAQTITLETAFTSWTFVVARKSEKETRNTSSEKKLKCTCPFCKRRIEAIIDDGKIFCPSPEKGGCGKSAPYKC